MAQDERKLAIRWRLYQFFTIWLMARFVWAAAVAGGEWPLPPSHYISMGIDLVLVGAILVLRSRLFDSAQDPRLTFANLLLVAGLVSGLGLIGIRFTSDAAWWTGHYRNDAFF
ncbi:MAG: hypothetical protein KF810_01550 [Rhizobiaceae bacterium]|nr:hypothetical protein [Rhizobiaceae bacterium]